MKVACGQPSRAASICGVWLLSSSIACLPISTRPGSSLADDRGQQLGHRQRLQLDRALDQDRPVGAHGQRRAQGLLAARLAQGHGDHLGRLAASP